ncbi:YARHG domain-containing protein [Archangium sp.]|jgi:hypothetical protein|uniref:YARHG domain-containing protein n=1 Tax=Archangium sp. TaxID=1872627 RepID=UPI002ED964C3
MRALVLTTLVLSAPALAAQPSAEYVPAPAKDVPSYSETVFPCEAVSGWKTGSGSFISEKEYDEGKLNFDPSMVEASTYVQCSGAPHLETLSLRELSLLRNTIFARYGWAGFRKPWLREHFQRQPWYKPDPEFSLRRLSWVDEKNVRLIVQAEMSLRYSDLERMRNKLLAKVTKRDAQGSGTPDLDALSPEDRIELGLISRAMGEFAVDEGQRTQAANSLDEVLKVKDLRQLSLRDLRLLRNTIYARRGRPFKSPLLQEHFQHMPWYKADKGYSDARLTATDKRNIALITQVEKEFGGALKDQDFRVANPSQAGDVNPPEPMMVA